MSIFDYDSVHVQKFKRRISAVDGKTVKLK